MAVNPILKSEAKVQIKDQTRFDASKCFVTKGEFPISNIKITIGANGSAVSIYDADQSNWYQDWLWGQFEIDIDTTNNKIPFKFNGIDYQATITAGTYSLSDLITEIAAELNSASAVVWTVALSLKNEITLTPDQKVELQGAKLGVNLLPVLGFDETNTDSEFEGLIIESLPRKITLTVVVSDPDLVFVAADQAAMLALTAVTGDRVYRQDTDEVYILSGADPTILGDWTLVTFTNPPVLTIDLALTGKTGTLTFETSDSFYQKVYSVEGDALFSSDADLITHESDILSWVPAGRNSFLDAHRRSQEKIMQWIDQNGYLDNLARRITKWELLDKEDTRLWSMYMTLYIVFMSFQNSKDDVLKEKMKYYETLMISARNQAMLDIDFNNDGKIEPNERVSTWSGQVKMR